MYSRAVQDLNVGLRTVAQACCVDLDETSAVYKNFRTHVTNRDKLCTIFYPLIRLLQRLKERLCLARAEAADELDEIARVAFAYRSVDVNSHLVKIFS